MTDSTNPRVMADNIKMLAASSGSQAADISTLQTTAETQGDAIKALGSYSATEVDTGMKYGDKTIYRKIFVVDPLPNNTTESFNHGIENLGDVLSIGGVSQVASKPGRNISVLFNVAQISVQTSTDLSDTRGIITIEYTKFAAPTPDVLLAPDSDTRSLEEPELEKPEPIEEKK